MPVEVSVKETLYQNPMASAADMTGFRLEGQGRDELSLGRLRLENLLDPSLGQGSNFVLWRPETFPADVKISWDFWPLREPGLRMLFSAARGRDGEDLFGSVLDASNGLRSICSKIIFAMERNIVFR